MTVLYRGVVAVDGRRLYSRGFWTRQDAERWFMKRCALAILCAREGEEVRVFDVAGKEVATMRRRST